MRDYFEDSLFEQILEECERIERETKPITFKKGLPDSPYSSIISDINQKTPVQLFINSTRSLICGSFKRKKTRKNNRTEKILGCSLKEFINYTESLFEDWMSWENRGKYNGSLKYGWDIDHIMPISSAKTIEDVIKLNHYTNLRPLCSYENRVIKKDKIIELAITE
jgi:hypothetical protein